MDILKRKLINGYKNTVSRKGNIWQTYWWNHQTNISSPKRIRIIFTKKILRKSRKNSSLLLKRLMEKINLSIITISWSFLIIFKKSSSKKIEWKFVSWEIQSLRNLMSVLFTIDKKMSNSLVKNFTQQIYLILYLTWKRLN